LADDFLINVEIDFKNAEQSARRMAEVLARFNAEVDSPALKRAEKNLAAYAGGADKAGVATKKMEQSLSTTRYALFSTGATLGIVGAAMIGLGVAVASTAITWERSFANVVRTSAELRTSMAGNGDAVATMRRELVDLAQTMPVTFEDLTKIATAGNQLGVTADNLAGFVKTVAQFSTVTGMTVDATATAFGRLDSLLPDVQHNYAALGSSILKVGVKSVATEEQITKTAVQISAMGRQAGLTASDVVGLAGAFASIGVQPELARGTVTRLFTKMGQAASENGPKLKAFADVSGVSAETFRQAWGTPAFGAVFLKFMQGIQKDGGSATQVLNDLGITSVRDVPALLNLANAADSAGRSGALLTQTMQDATSGFKEQSEIVDQYAIIADTVSARLQVLGNNFSALFDAIGQNAMGPLGDFLDMLSSVVGGLTDFASTDAGGTILGIAVAVTTLVGALTSVAAVSALAFAGIVGLQQALVAMGAPLAAVGVRGLIEQLVALGGASKAAAVGFQVLSVAAKGLGLAGVVAGAAVAATLITKSMGDISYAVQGLDTGFSATLKRVQKSAADLPKYFNAGDIAAQLNRGFAAFSGDTVLRDIAKVDEGLRDLANNGGAMQAADTLEGLTNSLIAQQVPLKTIKTMYTDSFGALKDAGFTIEKTRDGLVNIVPPTEAAAKAAGNLALVQDIEAQAAENAKAAHQALADTLGVSVETLDEFAKNISSSSAGFLSLDDTLQRTQDKAKAFAQAQADASTDATDSWENFYDGSSISLEKFMETLDEQIAEQQGWADSIAILVSKGAINAAQAMAEGGPKMADAAKQLAQAPLDELQKADEKFYLRGQLTTDAFGQGLTASIPALQDAGAKGGDAAVVALQNAMLTGSPSAVAAVVAQFNLDSSLLPIQFQSKLSEPALATAEGNLQAFSTRPRSPIEIGSEMSQPGLNATEGNLQAFRTAPRSPIEIGSRMNQPGLNATEGTLQAFRTAPRSPIEVGSEMNQPGLNRTEGTLQAFKNRPRTAIIDTEARTAAAESALNYLARSRTVTYTVQTVGSVQAVVGSNGQQITGIVGKATGGYIRGPGSGTSDSIPARLSNGEYVIRAATVRQYGVGFFDSINRGAAKFAQGGYVRGYAAGGAVSAGSNIVQLSPYDRRLLSIIADKSGVVIGHDVLANAANASNLNAAARRNN
jgi:TP901 family phage tail tape measure protein